jgi:hypothetical protein
MIRSVIRGLGLLPIVFLSACVNLGPDFETPEAPVADDWMEAEQAGVNYQAADDPEWWKVFNDPICPDPDEQRKFGVHPADHRLSLVGECLTPD